MWIDNIVVLCVQGGAPDGGVTFGAGALAFGSGVLYNWRAGQAADGEGLGRNRLDVSHTYNQVTCEAYAVRNVIDGVAGRRRASAPIGATLRSE